MDTLQQWTEANAWLSWLRESSSIWAYPTVLFVHTIGVVFASGLSLLVSARLVGAMPALPLRPFARLVPVIGVGVWLTILSGVVMLATDLTAKLGNQLLPAKLVLVVVSCAILVTSRRRVLDLAGEGQTAVPALEIGRAHV